MGDILGTAESVLAHHQESPWWNVSAQMNGPELRDRFNTTILPALDQNKDGHLVKEELEAGANRFAGTRDAEAVRLMTQYFSFLLDFRGGSTPAYFQAINHEAVSRYAEYDKAVKRFNNKVYAVVDYTLANFDRFDTDRSGCLSEEELKARISGRNEADRYPGEFLHQDWWSIKSMVPCDNPKGSGIGKGALLELRRRRMAPGEDETRTPQVPAEMPLALPVELADEPVEREDPKCHKRQCDSGKPPRVVPPRKFPILPDRPSGN